MHLKNFLKASLFAALHGMFFLFAHTAQAQTGKKIAGRVLDEKGTAMPGASVIVKGSNKGVITDSSGSFSLLVPDKTESIIIEFSGYDSRELRLSGGTTFNVQLMPDKRSKGLDEVVVVGYGTKKRANLTGSVVSIGGDELAKSPVASLSNSLAGAMPGLIVNTRSGEPGSDQATVYIRGIGTLGNTAPLVVIDGIPDRQGGFDRINPNDIASFTVLKDASGAIYGARAANGVILITTKRGISGKPSLSFNVNASATQATRVPKMLNAYQYAQSANEYNALIGQQPQYTPAQLQKYKDGSDPLGYPSTNWWDAVINPWAFQNNEVLSLRGGTEKVKYFVSGQYLHQNSIYKGAATTIITPTKMQGPISILQLLIILRSVLMCYTATNTNLTAMGQVLVLCGNPTLTLCPVIRMAWWAWESTVAVVVRVVVVVVKYMR